MINPAKEYLKNKIFTSPKEDLIIMLFDGAIRFCQQAKERLGENDFEGFNKLLIKAQRVMLELINGMDRKNMDEQIYRNLGGLYMFIYRQLVDANTHRDVKKIDDMVGLLSDLRQMWSESIQKLRQST